MNGAEDAIEPREAPMAQTVRSLRDLRHLFTYVPDESTTLSKWRDPGPLIPCTACGKLMYYIESVQRLVTDEWSGYGHATCVVDYARAESQTKLQADFADRARRAAAKAA
jgi:hypothetical protein